MHWLDISLLIVLGLGLALGAWSGLLWQVSRVVTVVAGVYVAIFGHPFLAELLRPQLPDWPDWGVTAVSFVLAFAAVVVVLLMVTWLIDRWLKTKKKLKLLDRVFGAGMGLVTTSLLAGALLFGMAIVATDWSKEQVAQSYLAPPLLTCMRTAISAMPEETRKSWTESIDKVRDTAVKQVEDAGKNAVQDVIQKNFNPSTEKKSEP
jgi:uncharacterized membrane protein required for colicin V production